MLKHKLFYRGRFIKECMGKEVIGVSYMPIEKRRIKISSNKTYCKIKGRLGFGMKMGPMLERICYMFKSGKIKKISPMHDVESITW